MSDDPSAGFGYTVSGAGDVNGDGYGDVLVGGLTSRPYYNLVKLYLGSATGLASAPAATWTSTLEARYTGPPISAAGDVNGDGYDDILIGDETTRPWQVSLHLGSSAGPASTATSVVTGASRSGRLSVAPAGDVDGDGCGDVLIGDYYGDPPVQLWYGSATGIDGSRSATLFTDDHEESGVNDVAGAGDLDADGYDDILVGRYDYCSTGGTTDAFVGSAAGLYTSASVTLAPVSSFSCFGRSVASAGDVNGDGYADVIVGAPHADSGAAHGYAVLFHGGPRDADRDGVPAGVDCDDHDPGAHPGALEACDGDDDDCDGEVDEGAPDDDWFLDADGDGYGGDATVVHACPGPEGYVATATDCDDGDAAIFPGAPETCDEADRDCDGDPYAFADDPPRWYADADGDGFGDRHVSEPVCLAPDGYVADATDCDDAHDDAWPGATEVCDDRDNDCDLDIDEFPIEPMTWYRDVDGDGHGDAASALVGGCRAPVGYVAPSRDCDDTRPDVHPGAPEACDDEDDNCDGLVDNHPVDGASWYVDADLDGYGTWRGATRACTQPPGTVSNRADCDDGDAARYPGATETRNLRDDDCDGEIDEPR